VYKYITQTHTYEIIIDEIIKNYIDAVKTNIKNCNVKLKYICLYNVVPPVKKEALFENPDFPFLGSNNERKQYVEYFNKQLKQKCIEEGWIFFDIYDSYCDEDRFLNKQYSDGNVHIRNGIYIKNFINDNFY
jgi:hypothetical protein